MRVANLLAAAALFIASPASAQTVFDDHVHLWDGENSLREYEAQIKAAGIDEAGFGGMWFGGPNQATIRGVGLDHVLLGSDYPQFTLSETLAAFEKLDLTPEEKDKIRYGNARALFGLKSARQ